MSESRTSLEQILELLLAEDTEKAEELLHEYVVGKARAEYERVLDEAEDDEMDIDHGDPAGDMEDEITDHEDEIDSDEEGDSEELDFGDEDEDEDDGEEGEEGEVEDKIDDLEKEIEDLRAELEGLIADQDMGDAGEMDMDVDADGPNRFVPMDMDADDDMEDGMMDSEEDELLDSVEYDLDEEELEEATKFSDKVADPKGGEADAGASKSPYTQAPKHTNISSQGKPVHAKDGAEGKRDHGSKLKTQNPTDSNIGVDHKKGPAAKDGKSHQDGSNKASPLSKRPK